MTSSRNIVVTARNAGRGGNRSWPCAGTCPDCGKRVYLTRKAARRAARAMFKGDHQSAYECSPGVWHFGHLPGSVIQGRWSRGEISRA